MPEPVTYKATFVFEQGARGWTESYHLQSSDLNYANAIERVNKVAEKRAALLGREAFIKGYRISRQDEKNEGYLEYKRFDGNKDQDCAQPDVAILCTAYDSIAARKKNIYLRGLWDAWEEKGGILTREDKLFQKAFNEWVKVLTANNEAFGWWGVIGRTRANVSGMTSDDEDRVTFTFAGDVFAPNLIGTKQRVRFTGINGRSGINGEHVVEVIGVRSCITAVPTRSVTYRFGGRVTFNAYGFIAIRSVGVQKVTSRDSGAPLLESRGRQRATPRG